MQIQEVAITATHSIKLFEFADTNGSLITYFFQAVKNPDISLGIYDTFAQAEYAIKLTDKFNITPKYLQE